MLKANKGKEEDIELIRNAVSFDKKTFDKISELVVDAAKNGNHAWRPMSGSNPKIGLYANGTELLDLRFRYDADPINRQKLRIDHGLDSMSRMANKMTWRQPYEALHHIS